MLILGHEKIQHVIDFFTGIELREDKNDVIANSILHLSQSLSIHAEKLFAGYLISEGIVKIVLLYGVYKDNTKVLPFAFLFFGIIVFYELYLLLSGHSLFIIVLILLDILLLGVIASEWRRINLKTKSSS